MKWEVENELERLNKEMVTIFDEKLFLATEKGQFFTRTVNDLGYADLARKAGTSRSVISMIQRGARTFTLKTFVSFMWTLGYRVNISVEKK